MKKKKKTNSWYMSISILSITILVLVILIIGFSNNTKKVYSFSGSGEYISFQNGLAIFSKKTNMIKLSDFKEGEFNDPVKKIEIILFNNDVEFFRSEKENINGLYIKDIVDDISFNVQGENLLLKEKNKFENSSYLKIRITTMNDKVLEEKIVFDTIEL